ncbi:hypothetical protein K450DRAFT_271675 [Umbelopsis ramanniana AG]|uniref:Single-stranded DNA binding protein Ssb-like OB fold domain-containing protein n=1 Tax=Umbelopsis ramanniana AG TaxID=1314678 RepID=A0AAD5HFA4_UMBRA|nr:uncharacterized protein K450DRAFT_271675 [Umbelopsis ramanniana AG]KAI8579843.1 hypothetical protein K450DRAFT_271675 [Umbelopsis ramanniana AG]
MNVFELVPDQHSLDLSVQVVSLLTKATYTHEKTGEIIQVAEYLVADPTAQVIFKAEADQIHMLEQHQHVRLLNARTTALHGHLRIVVDQHEKFGGRVLPDTEAIDIPLPSSLPNISDVEFTLS